jgi:fido (protein-threonine AMPylation protein)
MTRPIHLELFTDFFNKIGQKRQSASQQDGRWRGVEQLVPSADSVLVRQRRL